MHRRCVAELKTWPDQKDVAKDSNTKVAAIRSRAIDRLFRQSRTFTQTILLGVR